MEIFYLTLTQMLMMFTLILVGFMLRKGKLLPENSNTVMSKLELNVFLPSMTFYNMITNCTVATFKENYYFIFYGIILVIIAILISYPLSKLFVKKSNQNPEMQYQRSIYKYALAFGNYGYIGNFIVLGIWGGEGLFKYQMFTFFMSIACYTWGVMTLTPKTQEKTNLLKVITKAVTTPPVAAIILGIICGLLNLKPYLPSFFTTALSNASSCMGPVAMLLAGFVIGGYNIKELLLNKKVYIVSALRLVIIPALIVIVLKLLNTNEFIIISALIAFAVPLGLNTIVFPAAFGGDTKTGASMSLISTVLSVVTIPLMYYFLIVLF